jgi:hypothetical protein
LRLSGMGDEHVQEAAMTANVVIGFSAYLHGIGYSLEQFLRELRDSVDHIKSQQRAQGA